MRTPYNNPIYFRYSTRLSSCNDANGFPYRHHTIDFIDGGAGAVDENGVFYGHVFCSFEYQQNTGDVKIGDYHGWYGGSISGLTNVGHHYDVKRLVKLLSAWEKYLDGKQEYCRDARNIVGFLRKHKIRRVYHPRGSYSRWTFDRQLSLI